MAPSEELLNGINLMTEGKEAGFNILYSHTYNFVYGRARMLMKNEEDALDLTQETFIQAYKGIRSLENPENIYAWLGSIAYRQGMKIFRKKQEILVDEEAEGIFDAIVSVDKDIQPEESAEAKATSKIIMDLVEELPELQRAAVVAFYYDNMKIDDIAKAFECSANTIKSRLNYAKKFLKTKVEEHQRQNNYRLCTFSPALLVMALRNLFATDKYTIYAAVAEEIYVGACSAVGLVASAQVAGAVAAGTAGTVPAVTTAAKGAEIMGKLAAFWTAKKFAIAIAIATVSVATAAVAAPLFTGPKATTTVTDVFAPTQTPTPEPEVTVTLALEPMPELTATPIPTLEPTETPISTPESTTTPKLTLTPRPEPTATPTPEPTATSTPMPTATPLPTNTSTPTPTPIPTSTPTPTPTSTPTPTPEPTATPTPTPIPEITAINADGIKFVFLFDETGRQIAQEYYDSNGVLLGRNNINYLSETDMAGASLLDASGNVIGYYEYEYAEDRLFRYTFANESDSVIYHAEIQSISDDYTASCLFYSREAMTLDTGIYNKKRSRTTYTIATLKKDALLGAVMDRGTVYDGNGSIRYYEVYTSYTSGGLIERIDEYDTSNGFTGYKKYTYYGNGIAKRIDHYDSQNRLINYLLYDASGAYVEQRSFKYFDNGGVSSETIFNPDGRYVRNQYYSNGKVHSIYYFDVKTSWGWGPSKQIDYTYDSAGELIQYKVSEYTIEGTRASVTKVTTYDAAGNLIE